MSERRIIANRFEIHDLIGQGGMGAVYRGMDTSTNSPVAIKSLKPELVATPLELVARFEREGEALRRLNHPNIVKMLAAVEDDGQHYLVMEYVGGGSLQELLQEQPQLPVERVLHIGLELADALTRAHHLKIIHRDIKPANVLLAEDGTPRLTDFGVARMVDRTAMTQSGSLVGTYAYLSPEACHGQELDARADIWSFGVLLFEMMTGSRPFEGDQPAAIITSILTRGAPSLAELRPDAPPALVALIERMLEKDRESRISSVRLVAAELEAIIQGADLPSQAASRQRAGTPSRFATPTPDGPTTIGEPPARKGFLRSPQSILAVLGGLVVLLVAAFLGASALGLGKEAVNTTPVIEPVAPGEYRVVVAQLEHLGGEERDVSRFIADNLTQVLEVGVPFSTIRIRQYPQIIKTEEEAQAAAQASGATIIVWGNYNTSRIELNVQIGVTTTFTYIQMSREILERTANVRAQMTDELEQSIAPDVLGVLGVLQVANGDAYQLWQTLAILDQVNVNAAQVVSSGVAADVHRYFVSYLEDTPQAIQAMDAALALDGGNPLLHGLRSQAAFHELLYDAAREDAQTAQRLGPEGWAFPYYLFVNDAFVAGTFFFSNSDSTQILDDLVSAQPTAWFPYFFRGSIFYELREFDLAKADFERSIELNPTVNFPHVYATLIALREGRISDAVSLVNTSVAQFPDPDFMNRITYVNGQSLSYGGFAWIVQYLSAFGSLALGQYTDAAQSIPNILTGAEWDFIRGFAYCNLGQYDASEEVYSRAIQFGGITTAANRPSEVLFLFLLRAEVRMRLNDLEGAQDDIDQIQQSDQSEAYAPYIAALQSGALTCENFFSDNPVLAGA